MKSATIVILLVSLGVAMTGAEQLPKPIDSNVVGLMNAAKTPTQVTLDTSNNVTQSATLNDTVKVKRHTYVLNNSSSPQQPSEGYFILIPY